MFHYLFALVSTALGIVTQGTSWAQWKTREYTKKNSRLNFGGVTTGPYPKNKPLIRRSKESLFAFVHSFVCLFIGSFIQY